MLLWIFLLVLLLGLQFTVLKRGAPYLPTLHKSRQQALDLMGLKPGQTLIDLGSGDGAMLLAAAQRGLNVVGYEVNPLLVLVSRLRTRRHSKQVKVVWGNFWKKQWPEAEGVFVFLAEGYMDKLDKRMAKRYHSPIKLVSYGFPIKGKKVTAKSGPLFLYKYS